MEDISIWEKSVETTRVILIDTATEKSFIEDVSTEDKAVETTQSVNADSETQVDVSTEE